MVNFINKTKRCDAEAVSHYNKNHTELDMLRGELKAIDLLRQD